MNLVIHDRHPITRWRFSITPGRKFRPPDHPYPP